MSQTDEPTHRWVQLLASKDQSPNFQCAGVLWRRILHPWCQLTQQDGVSLTLTKEPDFRAAKMHDTIMVGPCHQTFIQTHRMHSTGEHPPVTVAAGQWLHGHTGSWLSQMHSGGDVVGGGGCACWGRGSWEISVLPTQFCCDPKMSLKKSSLKKRELSCLFSQLRLQISTRRSKGGYVAQISNNCQQKMTHCCQSQDKL